ncbi:MAG: glycosyltransferase family 2 protein [Bacteroidetes bacterium]|nr:glycosyltransferase family 2 protein [Bacteroidota bacterium]
MKDQAQSLISIVMPAKNVAAYIGECIDSVIDQSDPNWELIVIDDHSDDETPDILTSFAEKDQRVRWHQASGHGIISALRQAYSDSRGNLITRMDADDYMAPNKLEVLHKGMMQHGKGHVALGSVSYFSDADLGAGYRRYAEWLNDLTRQGDNFKEIYKECVIPSPCWMVFRSDLDQCGGFKSDIYPEDYDLCFRFYKAQLKVIPCEEILHFWRDHPERTSRNHDHYADNSFLELKVKYFMELDRDQDRPLILWGAGKRSKRVARLLNEQGCTFQWICNNPKKIGQEIYGIILKDDNDIDLKQNPQILIDIANKESQLAIKSSLLEKNRNQGIDDFFFC